MAVITPQTDVYLLKVPLEINDINQLTFSNATAQFNYFNSLPKLQFDNFTYQRKDGTIRVPGYFDELIEYNYVMYRNEGYSNKWFYAFITDMQYSSNGATDISIKTDVWQTWQFDLNYKPVLIDREHTNNDTIGANTLPEGLELGEMVTNGNITNFGPINESLPGEWVLVVDVTMIENPGENQTLTYQWSDGQTTPPQKINNIPSGLFHLIVGYNSSTVVSPADVIKVYEVAGLTDAIQNIYILPSSVLGEVQTGLTIGALNLPASMTPVTATVAMPKYSTDVANCGTFSYNRPTTIDGYTPVNKKLLCYPYNYLNVSNNVGSTLPFHYEDFTSGNASFKVEAIMTPSGSTKAIPLNYKNISGSENGYDYSINGAKYPMCSWITDSYTNWLTQNAVNMSTAWQRELVGGVVDVAGGGARGVVGGGLMGGIIGAGVGAGTATASLIGLAREQHLAKTQANFVADQVHGNLNSGDIVWTKNHSNFTFLPMSIKAEYARCIDEYFSQFGYKCNRVKIPNITGRRNWNYVKTVGCYILADIPQDDLQEIKVMFDKGITFWHNPATFGDYSQNNDII